LLKCSNLPVLSYFAGMTRLFSLLIITCLSGIANANAQTPQHTPEHKDSAAVTLKLTEKDYATYPHWITMMDEPRANYYEVQKAFYSYWKGKVAPVREDNEARDIFGANEKEQPRPVEYVYEYKRFKFWERYYKDLLDEQGFILSPEQIIAEWQKQQTGGQQK
jgi:hypothetical protein